MVWNVTDLHRLNSANSCIHIRSFTRTEIQIAVWKYPFTFEILWTMNMFPQKSWDQLRFRRSIPILWSDVVSKNFWSVSFKALHWTEKPVVRRGCDLSVSNIFLLQNNLRNSLLWFLILRVLFLIRNYILNIRVHLNTVWNWWRVCACGLGIRLCWSLCKWERVRG